MRRLIATFFCLFAVSLAQDTLWLYQLDLGSDEELIGITCQGEMIATVGYCTDTVNYDQEGLIVLIDQASGGIRLGTFDFGGDEELIDVFLDHEKSLYIAGRGSRSGLKTWRPRDLLRSPSFQQPYCIIAKFDSLGNQQWGIVDSPYVASGIAVDSQGNCYATGALGSGFIYDFLIGKILPNGDTAWTRRFDFNIMDVLYRPALDPSGNLIAPGLSYDLATMSGVIMKVSPDGETSWTRIDNSMPLVAYVEAAVDRSGRIFVTGFCGDSLNIDILIICFDSLGNEQWRITQDFSDDDEGLGIASDPDGYLYVTGYNADGDCVLLKLNFDGTVLWAERYDFGGYEYLQDLTLDPDKNLLACGLTDLSNNPDDLLLVKFATTPGIAQFPKPAAKPIGYCLLRNNELFIKPPVAGRYGIEIYNLTGMKVVRFTDYHLNSGENRIPLHPLPSGTYIIRIIGPNDRVIVNKGVVVR